MMTSIREKLLKIAAVLLIVAGLVGQVWSQRLWDLYFDTLPHSADKAAGRVYLDNNFHGVPVYETSQEHFRLYAVEYSSEALFFLGLVAGAFAEWKGHRAKKRVAGSASIR